MCGDGTNDVGALRHAHVGVAILTEEAANGMEEKKEEKREEKKGRSSGRSDKSKNWKERLEVFHFFPFFSIYFFHLLNFSQQEEEAQSSVVKLGDASIAAPFTSRSNSVTPLSSVLQQGYSPSPLILFLFFFLI